LLTTKQMAEWFRVSEQWLVIGRSKRYGPANIKISPNNV